MKTQTIQSLERGLKILDILSATGRPLLLSEIAEHFSIDRSSVFRLVGTLVKCGYVSQDPETKRYAVGFKVSPVSGALNGHFVNLVRPVMIDVVAQTGQNAHLAALDGKEVVFIAVEQPQAPVGLTISVGNREPVTVTALGKTLIAFMPEEERREFLAGAPMKKYTPKSVATRSGLEKDLANVRRNRIAVDDEEYRTGVVCLAAPIFDHEDRVLYSIGISGLRDDIKPNQQDFGRVVQAAGRRLSARMGYSER